MTEAQASIAARIRSIVRGSAAPGQSAQQAESGDERPSHSTAMSRFPKPGALLSVAAFTAGWLYRQAFPKVVCPRCGSDAWRRMGGGLKECRRCSWKFFSQLPAAQDPKR
jgi:hypothetical protein